MSNITCARTHVRTRARQRPMTGGCRTLPAVPARMRALISGVSRHLVARLRPGKRELISRAWSPEPARASTMCARKQRQLIPGPRTPVMISPFPPRRGPWRAPSHRWREASDRLGHRLSEVFLPSGTVPAEPAHPGLLSARMQRSGARESTTVATNPPMTTERLGRIRTTLPRAGRSVPRRCRHSGPWGRGGTGVLGVARWRECELGRSGLSPYRPVSA